MGSTTRFNRLTGPEQKVKQEMFGPSTLTPIRETRIEKDKDELMEPIKNNKRPPESILPEPKNPKIKEPEVLYLDDDLEDLEILDETINIPKEEETMNKEEEINTPKILTRDETIKQGKTTKMNTERKTVKEKNQIKTQEEKANEEEKRQIQEREQAKMKIREQALKLQKFKEQIEREKDNKKIKDTETIDSRKREKE